jgi:hypothetical protein
MRYLAIKQAAVLSLLHMFSKNSVNIGCQKKMGPVTAAALTARHTPTLISFNDTSWIGKGKLLFWEFTYSSN